MHWWQAKTSARLYGHIVSIQRRCFELCSRERCLVSFPQPRQKADRCHKGVAANGRKSSLSSSCCAGRARYLHLMFYGRAINIFSLMNAYVFVYHVDGYFVVCYRDFDACFICPLNVVYAHKQNHDKSPTKIWHIHFNLCELCMLLCPAFEIETTILIKTEMLFLRVSVLKFVAGLEFFSFAVGFSGYNIHMFLLRCH